MIKAVIFDFDGVIVESLDIKERGFIHVFREYPEIKDKIVKLHTDNAGMTRFDKFQYIYKHFLNKNITDEIVEQLALEFSTFVKNEVIRCGYVPGAIEFLEKYHNKYDLFVVTGTPHPEIDEIIESRGLLNYFKGIYGSPARKGELNKKILNEFGYKKQEVLYVGDDPKTDHAGAIEAGINFIGREINPSLKLFAGIRCSLISDLTHLHDKIQNNNF